MTGCRYALSQIRVLCVMAQMSLCTVTMPLGCYVKQAGCQRVADEDSESDTNMNNEPNDEWQPVPDLERPKPAIQGDPIVIAMRGPNSLDLAEQEQLGLVLQVVNITRLHNHQMCLTEKRRIVQNLVRAITLYRDQHGLEDQVEIVNDAGDNLRSKSIPTYKVSCAHANAKCIKVLTNRHPVWYPVVDELVAPRPNQYKCYVCDDCLKGILMHTLVNWPIGAWRGKPSK